MTNSSEDWKEKYSKTIEFGKKVIHVTWIPLVIYLGKKTRELDVNVHLFCQVIFTVFHALLFIGCLTLSARLR